MKRMTVLILALCLMLTGCGRGEPESVMPETTPVPVLTDALQTEILPEQVIYDAGGIRITVTGMEEKTMSGTEIKILVENGTDHNIAFSGDLFVVNGVTVPGYLYAQAAAGMKCRDSIELYSDVLNTAGITQVGSIRGFDARIVDTDTYETLAKVPLELTTAYAEGLHYTPDESGFELFRTEGVTVTAQVISEEFYGKTVQLLVKNNTGKDIILEAENISVNGYTVDAWLYDTVCADTIRFCQLDLFQTGLAENGIDQVENVTFNLNILDAASYETIAKSERLTVEVVG